MSNAKFIIHVSSIVRFGSKIVLVKEGKPGIYGQWNLPGGHLEEGEELIPGALREIKEETGLDADIEALIGVYTGFGKNHCLDLIFQATAPSGEVFSADQDILECAWFTREAIDRLDDTDILNFRKFRKAFQDFDDGKRLTIEHINEWMYGSVEKTTL